MLDVVKECDRVVVAPEQQNLAIERGESVQRRIVPEGIVPGLRGKQLVRRASPTRRTAPHAELTREPGIRPQELDEHTMVPRRARGFGVERRQLLEDLRFLRGRQIAASNFVDVAAGNPRTSSSVPFAGQRVLEREMDLIRAAGYVADRAYRRVHHHDIAGGDAKRPKAGSQLLSGIQDARGSGAEMVARIDRRPARTRRTPPAPSRRQTAGTASG